MEKKIYLDQNEVEVEEELPGGLVRVRYLDESDDYGSLVIPAVWLKLVDAPQEEAEEASSGPDKELIDKEDFNKMEKTFRQDRMTVEAVAKCLNESGYRYVMRIYTSIGCKEPPFVPFGEDTNDCVPDIIRFAKNKKKLLKLWKELLKEYGGSAYTIYPLYSYFGDGVFDCVVGGNYAETDDEIILDNLDGID